jgi:hypothetical protein
MPSNPYFDGKVKGRIRAEFVGGDEPIAQLGERLNHYQVRVFLETQNPDIERVTYKLDPTYYDPVRESVDRSRNYEVSLTTYGDYPVTVEVQVGSEIVRQTTPLLELLQETHRQSHSPRIQDALREIATH